MKQKSIVKNYIYNVTLTILNMIFPIITFPYASRVIGANGIGKVNFVNSIASYFILFASLGIPTYGIRQIAKVRNSKDNMSKAFFEIFLINAFSTLLCLFIYYVCILSFDAFSGERLLYFVTGMLIFFNGLNIDWFYQGIEEYKFIMTRSIVFKIISIILLFVLVHTKKDYVIYAAINVIAISGSNIMNLLNSRRYIRFEFDGLHLKKHIKPIFILFSTQVASSVYIYLDSIMTGLLSGNASVGYYTASIKIDKMSLSIVTALSSVLLPRLSYYIENDMNYEFDRILLKSIKVILLLSIPITIGLYMLAPEIILLFSGREFIPAILSMRIMTPIVLIISLSYFINVQVFIPLGKEKLGLKCIIFGAIVNVILNIILIPYFKHIGTAISTSITELCVTMAMIFYSRYYIMDKLLNIKNIKYVLSSSTILLNVFLMHNIFNNYIVVTLLSIIISSITYATMLLVLKDDIVISFLNTIKIRLSNKVKNN